MPGPKTLGSDQLRGPEKNRRNAQAPCYLVGMGRGTSTAELIDPKLRSKPQAGKRSALDREAFLTQRTLRIFDDLMKIAESMPAESGDEVTAAAWRAIDGADPVRVLIAEQLLGVSGQTVREWIDKGVLEAVDGSPVRVTLASVLETKNIVDELRELGQDRDLVSAVLNQLELEELEEDDRFRKSLEQMKRGERGEFPARYGL